MSILIGSVLSNDQLEAVSSLGVMARKLRVDQRQPGRGDEMVAGNLHLGDSTGGARFWDICSAGATRR
jgi:hypothetical protein